MQRRLACGDEESGVSRTPSERVGLSPMSLELRHGLPRNSHVQDLHPHAVHVERGHVVRVCEVEGYPEERGCGQSSGTIWRGSRRGQVLRCGSLVEDGRVLEAAQVEQAQRAVSADRDEDVGRPREPRDVVHLTVVRDKLGGGGGGIDRPNSTRCVDRGGDDQAGRLRVP